MARLKFLVFALLVLAVWAAHLVLLSKPLAARSVELAMAHAQAARPLAQAEIAERRQLLQRAATKLAAQPKLQATVLALKAPSAKEAVPADKLQALKAMAEAQAPDALKGGLVFGYATEGGATFFRGGQPAESGVDAALGKAGPDGLVQEAFGVSHLFVSLPVFDKGTPEPKQAGAIILGTPLLTDGMMEAVAKDASLAAAGVFQRGRLVQGGGPQKAQLEKAAKLAQAGAAAVVERGATTSLGPFHLPLFTSPEDRGGHAPLLIASRQAIEETPYEFIAVASVEPMMSALGGYQRFALGVLGGLVVLTLVWAVLIGRGGAEAGEDEDAEENELAPGIRASVEEPGPNETAPGLIPPPEAQLASTMPDPSQEHRAMDPRLDRALGATREDDRPDTPFDAPPEPSTYADAAAAPAPPPDPFAQYGGGASDFEGTTRAESPFARPGQDLSEAEPEPTPAQPVVSRAPPSGMGMGGGGIGGLGGIGMGMGMAPVPVSNPSISAPFAQETVPRFSSDPSDPVDEQDDNPDATRVAAIPQELLESARRTATNMPAPRQSGTISLPKMPAVAAATPSNPDEAHYQEVYREFVTTRERCGEPADGLTYDKFAAKLRKNKEQLVAKYACKTVRFQVYVKEGKAALKATPVKE